LTFAYKVLEMAMMMELFLLRQF